MRLRVRQGGQTGVDRGAWHGAKECGLDRCGWMPNDMMDEYGLIPEEVRADLKRHRGGLSARTIANVEDADAVLIIVPDATRGCTTPGTQKTWRVAFNTMTSRLVIDGSGQQMSRVMPWLHDVATRYAIRDEPIDLMLAGPRASLWPEGEACALRLVRAIWEATRTTAATSGKGTR